MMRTQADVSTVSSALIKKLRSMCVAPWQRNSGSNHAQTAELTADRRAAKIGQMAVRFPNVLKLLLASEHLPARHQPDRNVLHASFFFVCVYRQNCRSIKFIKTTDGLYVAERTAIHYNVRVFPFWSTRTSITYLLAGPEFGG